jgi:ribosomal protein L7/L12
LDELPQHAQLGKIWRIKILRAAYNLGLKEAKDMLEAWDEHNKLPF